MCRWLSAAAGKALAGRREGVVVATKWGPMFKGNVSNAGRHRPAFHETTGRARLRAVPPPHHHHPTTPHTQPTPPRPTRCPSAEGELVMDGSPANARACVEGSLQRLGIDCIDIFTMRGPVDPEVSIQETMAELKASRRAGTGQLAGTGHRGSCRPATALPAGWGAAPAGWPNPAGLLPHVSALQKLVREGWPCSAPSVRHTPDCPRHLPACRTLQKLVEEGKVRHLGLSEVSAAQVRAVGISAATRGAGRHRPFVVHCSGAGSASGAPAGVLAGQA